MTNCVQLRPCMPDLIVAIDFGMTATSIAYFSKGLYMKPLNKIPTVLLYERQEDGQMSLLEWGIAAARAAVTESTTKIEWFKVLLHGGYLEMYQSRKRVDHIEVKRWVIDYLSRLRLMIEEAAKGFLKDVDDWSGLRVIFAFAAPDLWSLEDRVALSNYFSCIKDAGFGRDGPGHRVLMESEAVAAAAYFEGIEPGQTWKDREAGLVIDSGGGTMDINRGIVHIANKTPRFTTLQVLGTVTGVCGVNYLIRLEECFKEQLLCGSKTTKTKLPWSKLQPYLRNILTIKVEALMKENVVISVDLASLDQLTFADDIDAGISKNQIILSSQRLKQCTTSLINDIENRLRQTIDRDDRAGLIDINFICVAGGWSMSTIFKRAVQQWKDSSANASIRSARVLQSSHARMEVAMGLITLARRWFNFVDCTLKIRPEPGPLTELVTVHGGYQPFQKRIKCGKDSMFSAISTRIPKHDVLNNQINTYQDVLDVQFPMDKTPIFGKGIKLLGIANDEIIELKYDCKSMLHTP